MKLLLPYHKLPPAHVMSSAAWPDRLDNLHFAAEIYRMLGKRYNEKMPSLLTYF
ncbi:hypothetical protein [Pedobacter cryotolerans]|uniref:hypothetical protein n=1 Tax=Pedobacter cryotolerans TaxID=2571270 RepID=UPI00197DBF72|nr:hypothetical protein [Pedobacter cryotolerans]